MREKLHTKRTLVVEGRYDAARLANLVDAPILLTDGFGIYTDRERQQLLKKLAQQNGLLLLTDPDAAGFRIRTYITNLVGEMHVLQAYVPACPGKETRKSEPGKEGLLGVEGIPDDVLYALLEQTLAADQTGGNMQAENCVPGTSPDKKEAPITYTDLYEWGLSGTAGAAERKAALLHQLGLPPRLSKKELVEVLNRLYTRRHIEEVLDTLRQR